jgi:glycosyltransferase domain-containing protein
VKPAIDLSQLTVVIPTVSRPLFVIRQFEYWRDLNAQVVILDGAPESIDIPSDLKSPNIRYLHTGTRFNERLATAGQYVDTKYCALLPDDEFYLPSGMHAAIERLEKDPSVIGCVGRCLYFFVDQGRFLLKDAYREWLPFPDTARTVHERLDVDLPPLKTHKAQFAIMRSDHWKTMFERSYTQFFSCGYTYERFLNLQRTVLGRTEILDDVLWMRSMENPPISSVNVPRVDGRDFVSWARNPEFASEVTQYRQIALQIIESGGITSDEAKALEERFFVGGIHRQATKEERNRTKISRRIATLMLTRSPKVLRLTAKRFLPARWLRFTGWEGHDLDAMCASLEVRGTRFSRSELERVRELSLKLDQRIRRQERMRHDIGSH